MIWIDITNLPHVAFFGNFIKSKECFVTTREFGNLTSLLDAKGIGYTKVGKHGGRDPREKLIESGMRVAKLGEMIGKRKIDAALSKHSVELPRVGFGLDIPTYQFLDNEYAYHQNKLSLPLCDKIIAPAALDFERVYEAGARKDQIVKFNGVMETVQIKDFVPDRKAVEEITTGPYVLIRPPPFNAAYYDAKDITQDLIYRVKEEGYLPLVIPRGGEKYRGAITIRTANTLNIAYFAAAVIGGGGTMNREAALLGTPTISYYPQKLLGVDRFLIKKGLLKHSNENREVMELFEEIVDKKEELRKKVPEIIKDFEDPFQIMEKDMKD